MKATVEWQYSAALSKNKLYNQGDQKLGPTAAASVEMNAITWLLRGEVNQHGLKFTADEDNRIQVTIKVYRPTKHADAQNFETAICDAIKLGIHVDDNMYDVKTVGLLDKGKPRFEITVEQR